MQGRQASRSVREGRLRRPSRPAWRSLRQHVWLVRSDRHGRNPILTEPHPHAHLAQPCSHPFPDRKTPRHRQPGHGRHQPSAGLGRWRRDAGRWRQCGGRGGGRAVHPDGGRADDGRHPGRWFCQYPPGRRQPDHPGRPGPLPAGGGAGHLHARPRCRPRRARRAGPAQQRGPGRRGRARQPDGLVPDAAAPRQPVPGRRGGARHPPRRTWFCRHRLPGRLRGRLRRRPGAGR